MGGTVWCGGGEGSAAVSSLTCARGLLGTACAGQPSTRFGSGAISITPARCVQRGQWASGWTRRASGHSTGGRRRVLGCTAPDSNQRVP